MRWCQIHGLVIGSAKRKMHNFITYEDEGDDVDKLRIQRLPPKWSSELRLVSKLSFMLPLCTPTDLVAVAAIGPPCDGGVAVSPLWVCTVFLAQTIKWPAVVRKWYQLCREGPATCASDFVTHYVAVVKWASGRDWGDMFRRMDGGLQHAQTGLAVNAQALGIVKSCRKRSKTTVDGIKDVSLGPLNAPHMLNEDLAPAIDIVQHIITQATSMDLHWPGRVDDLETRNTGLRELGSKLIKFACEVCSQDRDNGYKVRSFLRVVLYILEREQPDVFDGILMQEVLEWCPDESKHCDSISPMLVRDCRRQFTVSPLLISCFTCLTGWMSQANQDKLFQVSDDKIWEVMQGQEIEQPADPDKFSNAFSIGPHMLLDAMAAGS